MRYISTRGNSEEIDFKEATLRGLAGDGGLYIPKHWPKLDYNNCIDKSYEQIAFEVISLFTGNTIEKEILKSIINKSYSKFNNDNVVSLKNINTNNWILELYHGPTLAFKDIALQFLGQLFDHFLKNQNRITTVIGATSGDTGAAAIEALKDKKNIQVFILHPYKKVSDFQRKQMTTINSKNVHNIAIEGNFDDCQAIIKSLFSDNIFNKKFNLSSINSINWTRVMAQMVYYVYCVSRTEVKDNNIVFSVPTGNFGDIYAGYMAKCIGTPIEKLIISTNSNDILNRFFRTSLYSVKDVVSTISPSMDIQVASNFERLLYDIENKNPVMVNKLMNCLKNKKSFKVTSSLLNNFRNIFHSYSINEETTINTIKNIYREYNLIIDPHTAVGIAAAEEYSSLDTRSQIITLSTAHPVKFKESIKKAIGCNPELPFEYKDLFIKKEYFSVLPNNINMIKDYIINVSV